LVFFFIAFVFLYKKKILKEVVFLLCITSQNIIHCNNFFTLIFLFYPLIFGLLDIELHDLLQFAFYMVIQVS